MGKSNKTEKPKGNRRVQTCVKGRLQQHSECHDYDEPQTQMAKA
jgi:hypothetical protein